MAIISGITAALITGAITGGTTLAATKMGNSASKTATAAALTGNQQALAYERERDRIESEQYDREYQRRRELEDQAQRDADDARLFSQADRDRNFGLDEQQLALSQDQLALNEDAQKFSQGQITDRQHRLDPFRVDGAKTYNTLSHLLSVPNRSGTLANFLRA